MRPEEELRFLILGAQREGNRLLVANFAPLGLTPSQAEVISCLNLAGAMSLRQLGKLLVCETGSPSRLVDTLVNRKIVLRREDPTDRRQVTLELSTTGAVLAQKVEQVERKLYGQISKLLSTKEIAATIGSLRALTEGSPSGQAVSQRRALKSNGPT
jgi:DNA-binding MarR family transcriptional regulator